MTKPAIAAARKLPDALAGALRDRYEIRDPASAEEEGADYLIKRATGARTLLVTSFDEMNADLIARLPESIEYIASIGVGYDHIDLDAAKAKGVMVSNTPDTTTPCLADTTIGLIICACRRFRAGLEIAMTGEGRGMLTPEEWGLRVSGKTLGIVGMGNIGKAVAKRARGFDMKILYTTPRPSPEIDREYDAEAVPLDELLKRSDIVSLHCPLKPETRRLIDRDAIAKMKQGAVLINVARGPVVDETALIEALKFGHLFAAGLDVFETEPGEIRADLRALPNVFPLPHIGSATFDSRIEMAMSLIANIDTFFQTGAPRDRLV